GTGGAGGGTGGTGGAGGGTGGTGGTTGGTSPSISTDADITNGLRSYMLEVPEDLIATHYGIRARANSPLEIKYANEGAGGSVAYVTTSMNSRTGEGISYSLTIDRDDFFKDDDDLWISKDRIVAHEMVHGIMAASGMNWKNSAIPVWFKEGTAEYLPGADERVIGDLRRKGSNQALVNCINSPTNTSEFYSASYTAIKYLDHKLHEEGQSIKDLMQSLADGSLKTLDAALKELKNADGTDMYSGGESAFKNDFLANGANFMTNHMDLSPTGGTDGVGSIMGNRNDDNVIPDANSPKDNPLDNFNITWGASTGYTPGSSTPYVAFSPVTTTSRSIGPGGIVKIQTGANSGESMDVRLTTLSSNILGIDTVDVINNAGNAITLYDNALETVSQRRANLGALQNRLEHSMKICDNTSENLTNSESRIRDLDMAKEVLMSSKLEILINANQSVMSQAKATREGILKLLA
ncbi:MAG: flagellinolysin, partial [Peptostreptococcaceae bacterium]|nr:flagellinolysin [Peptostreptococcaceae bacterium]